MKVNTLWGEEEIQGRICSTCLIEKSHEEFSMDTTYLRSKCKKCKKKQNNILAELKKHHSPPSNKDYSCPICKDTVDDMKRKGYVKMRLSWCLDHDHTTGAFRGFICNICNTGLSNLQDDIEVLQSAIRYLRIKR